MSERAYVWICHVKGAHCQPSAPHDRCRWELRRTVPDWSQVADAVAGSVTS